MRTLVSEINDIQETERFGQVAGVRGLLVEVTGGLDVLSIGMRVRIQSRTGGKILCEVVGFKGKSCLVMPFSSLDGVGIGCKVSIIESEAAVYPSRHWLGRVLNSLGEPMDGKGPLIKGDQAFPLHGRPPPAGERQRVGGKIDLGVRALNAFVSCCRGQRMGIFSGSGVGKSILLSMLARYTSADVSVVGLIGERGREVREFIEDDLGEEGLARSVVIVATSDESALMRRSAAHLTMAVAEYFRDQNNEVLCLMDSVTRFAMAQREIGLAGGEPPTTRGYTPTVFSELPKLLERAGPGRVGSGNITGLFTVLVEGDDHNEPVADAVRGILDGHIVMDRAIAERGRFPAINVLRSVSRTLPDCNTPEENHLIGEARRYLSAYADMEEMIRLGAYRSGANAEVDRAIHLNPALEAFLAQDKSESTDLDTCYRMLTEILAGLPD